MTKTPKIDVTIGVPVYNGASLIEESLQSLCDDELKDMKIVIYDNASTDKTAQIAQRFVEKTRDFLTYATMKISEQSAIFAKHWRPVIANILLGAPMTISQIPNILRF